MSKTPPTLEQMQSMVGGFVEMIPTRRGVQAFANEEGLLKRLPPNTVASILFGCHLVGPVVIMTGELRWQ